MYKLFFNNPEFEKFAVSDLIQRGTQTIKIIRNDPDIDLDEVTLSDLCAKNPLVSNPFAFSFLAEQLIKMDKLSIKRGDESSQALISVFEVFMSFAILFGSD